MDEYYFWLVNTQFYAYTDQTDAQDGGDASFTGSYQFGFQDSYYDASSSSRRSGTTRTRCRRCWRSGSRARPSGSPGAACTTASSGSRATSDGYVAIADDARSGVPGAGRGLAVLPGQRQRARCPPGTATDTSPPGFRYDLPPDDAVALPQVLAPPAPPPRPRTRAGCPPTRSSPTTTRAPGCSPRRGSPPRWPWPRRCGRDCAFELALRWYRRAFDPLKQDCTWMHCPATAPTGPRRTTQPGQRTAGRPAPQAVGAVLRQHRGRPSRAPRDRRRACCTTARRCWTGATR